MSIYKACDIRGDASTELSIQLYRSWGMALGNMTTPGATFVVGRDVRISSGPFSRALVNGLRASGARLVDLGVVPTPMVYFAHRQLDAGGCATVTASHSPPNINGLKWMVGAIPADEGQVAALRATAPSEREPEDSLADTETTTILERYVAWLRGEATGEECSSLGPIVVDPGNGCWAELCGSVLQAVYPDGHFELIHDRRDGRFPDRNPDCAKPEYLKLLSAAVRKSNAGLGIAFDGDGDRVAFVDDEGQALTAEEATWVLVTTFGETLSGRRFVYDVKFSDKIPRAASDHGATPIPQRSGHAFIRTCMLEEGAAFGAELSGHYFYDMLDGGDDGLFTACRMMTYLAETEHKLSQLRRQCPSIAITPDLRLKLPDDQQESLIEQARETFRAFPQSELDGIRIDFPKGWALLRKSVTEAAVSCRCEGEDSTALDQIVRQVADGLGPTGERLWDLYQRQES